MSMSKKHFIALADTMRDTLSEANENSLVKNGELFIPAADVIVALGNFCDAQNPNFKRGRWESYLRGECGPNGGAVKRSKAVAA